MHLSGRCHERLSEVGKATALTSERPAISLQRFAAGPRLVRQHQGVTGSSDTGSTPASPTIPARALPHTNHTLPTQILTHLHVPQGAPTVSAEAGIQNLTLPAQNPDTSVTPVHCNRFATDLQPQTVKQTNRAPADRPAPLPPDLQAIVAAWPSLPHAVQAGMIAMVKAVSQKAEASQRPASAGQELRAE